MDIQAIEEQASQKVAKKDFTGCISLLTPLVSSGDATAPMHKIYAESLYEQGRYVESLPSFQYYLSHIGFECPFAFFQKTRSAVGKSRLSKKEALDFWQSCSAQASIPFIQSYQALLDENFALAEQKFKEGLEIVYEDDTIRSLWHESFAILKDALLGSAPSDYTPAEHGTKIFVSGSGWSGSSAFFDYFSEFEAVSRSPLEPHFIEYSFGLVNMVQSASDEKLFVKSCILFFYYALLGQGEVNNQNDFKLLHTVQALATRKLDSLEYARRCRAATPVLANCIVEYRKKIRQHSEILCDLFSGMINELVVGTQNRNKVVLLDNAIHIGRLDLFEYIKNAHVFCSFRDPRSNYTALCREYAGFRSTADEYIATVNKTRKKFETEIDRMNTVANELKTNTIIHKIEFEQFVISENFRDGLAESIGLDLSKRRRHSLFKPWESLRNVNIYQEHLVKEDIIKIERELREYCRELCMRKLPPEAE